MTHVVVFSGGRGATTILKSLARTRGVRLTVVVNAYDAGLSTGRVRRAISGILGPSDIRKTAGTLAMAVGDDATWVLADLFEARLHAVGGDGLPSEECAVGQFDAIVHGRLGDLDSTLRPLVKRLTLETWFTVSDHLVAFQKGLIASGIPFSYGDLAIGNAVLAGMYLASTMNAAVDAYQDLLRLQNQRVLNVTTGEDLWLCASAGDFLCPDEGTLVAEPPPAPITDLFLLPRHAYEKLVGSRTAWSLDPATLASVKGSETLPSINPRVDAALRSADVIVYGPGTQHSSLFPSYLTVGVGEAIAANRDAEKIFVANITRDCDQLADETITDILAKFHHFMSRRGSLDLGVADLISSVLVDDSGVEALQQLDSSIATRSATWADNSGRHSGTAVKEEISSAVRLRSGEQLPGESGLLTIIVPVLDEAPRVGSALQQLRYLDLGHLGLLQEIIVVDGGSTDGTQGIIRAAPDVQVVEGSCRGRGDAVRLGLQRARGEYVVVFPSDGEYDVEVIGTMAAELQRHPDVAILASRTLSGSSASHRLRAVYGENRLLYLLSHWGGTLVTLLLMLRLDRIVGDPLSGVRGARRDLFRELDNFGRGLDYDVSWVTRAVRTGHRVVEVPVNYRPRSWRDGKKTDIWDGLRALRAVFTDRARETGTPAREPETPHRVTG